MSSTLFCVFTNPATEEQDAEFSAWYDATHIPDILQVSGIKNARRYQFAKATLPGTDTPATPPSKHRYMTVYEVEGDPGTVMQDFLARTADGRMPLSPSLDLATLQLGFWQPLGEQLQAG